MPGKVKVKILAGKNLPVMDRSSDTTDAYVEIKLGTTTYKTEVCRKSLNPQWNSDWYRFEVDDSELQDEPLQIRLMDHDTYSANDAIGKVYVDLNPLLLPSVPKSGWSGDSSKNGEHSTNSLLSGWFPVYDTMHGIRGEVNIMVKVELFSDFNKFRQSSCGVHFFCSQVVPHGYAIHTYHGFVEELIVNDDPEYQWIDKIRTPRASNEARQTLFFKLAGALQRKIGVKALELGGNAVIGYSQCFDLEGELGVVVRGVGTAVTLMKLRNIPPLTILESNNEETVASPGTELNKNDCGHQRTESVGAKISQSPGRFQMIPYMNRRSSDSDLSITPKGFFRKRNSLTGSDKSTGVHNTYISRIGPMLHSAVPQNNFEMLEYPFMTISKFPPGFVMYLGGVVSARSVKLLERITNLEEPESRDTWWTELRMEIRSHMRSVHCNSVIAYTESSSICDDVCVLSASGTAAVIQFQNSEELGDSISGLPNILKQNCGNKDIMASSLDRGDFERERLLQKQDLGCNSKPLSESPENEITPNFVSTISPCTICHLPYTNSSVPFRTISSKCGFCKFGKVPELLMATMEIPDAVPSIGRGCFVQAYVCRPLKDLRSELNAKDISDGLPFLEYELHRLLVNKIRVKGMNAVFGLRVRISVGTKMLVGIATGTGVFLLPLPSPPLPKLVSIGLVNDKQLIKMQQHLYDTIQANKEIYQLKLNDNVLNSHLSPDTDHQNEEEQSFLDLSLESRDCCILEVDDPEDKEIMELLREPPPPDGFHVINTEIIPGLEEMEIIKNLQMFTQIWRSKVYPSYNFGTHISKLLQSVYFKLRRMVPCALCNLKFRIDLPEPDEIQLTVLGMALELKKSLKQKRKNIHGPIKESTRRTDEDMMFNLEEDVADSSLLNVQPVKNIIRSPYRNLPNTATNVPHREKHSIDITPLSYVPSGKIERYLGNLNFFFIRETTSIREEGGLSGFIHTFVTEVLAIVRAHIAALGGNAMVAYYMTECDVSHSLHKNQGQCLINVGGDVVFVSYFAEE